MQIQWLGLSCFKIQTKEAVVLLDPFMPKYGPKPTRFKADILLISRDEETHNNRKSALGDAFVIESPGEYELKNIFLYAFPGFHESKKEEKRKSLTMFRLEAEHINIAHLSDLSCVPSEKHHSYFPESLYPKGNHFVFAFILKP